MSAPEKDEVIEVTCPECGAKVRVAKSEAERKMTARCPKGHEVGLVKLI